MELGRCNCANCRIGIYRVIGGLVSLEGGLSFYMILASSGISGAMGSVALSYFWERITGLRDADR